MRKLISVIALCLLTFPALCQSKSKYQVATITEVKSHQGAGDGTPDATSYDVSVKVDGTIYVVQYTPPLGMITVRYATGRELTARTILQAAPATQATAARE